MKRSVLFSALVGALALLSGRAAVHAQATSTMGLRVDTMDCGATLTVAEGATQRLTVYAYIDYPEATINGWSLSIAAELPAGSPHSIKFLDQISGGTTCRCSKACQARQIFGVDADGEEILFSAPVAVDPAKNPTEGPLKNTGPQGPGFIDGVALTIDATRVVTLPAGRHDVLKMCFDVTRATGGPAADVRLFFKNGLQGTGSYVENSISIGQNALTPEFVTCTVKIPGGVVVQDCPAAKASGLYFGGDSKVDATITGEGYNISMRNDKVLLGYSLAVARRDTAYTFENDVVGTRNGQGEEVKIELLQIDADGNQIAVADKNKATGPAQNATKVEVAANITALLANPDDDFLITNLQPNVGGPGFTAGYTIDINGSGKTIPVTGTSDTCPTQNILRVTLGTVVPADPFSRGDTNGDGKINIADPIIMVQNIFLGKIKLFDCDDMLDANNDGAKTGADPVALLNWLFIGADNLAAPFRTCGDDTDTRLDCKVTNCRP